jgi:hypothetical protein
VPPADQGQQHRDRDGEHDLAERMAERADGERATPIRDEGAREGGQHADTDGPLPQAAQGNPGQQQ